MYVLRDTDDFIYPADRCRFKSTWDSTNNYYSITEASFYDGSSATPVSLSTNVELGYIGKSGRFVAITD